MAATPKPKKEMSSADKRHKEHLKKYGRRLTTEPMFPAAKKKK